jgi:hypothetical protein
MSLRDEEAAAPAVTPHSPQPTAVPRKAAARLHAVVGRMSAVRPRYRLMLRLLAGFSLILCVFAISHVPAA